jgi:hypothetical protein
MGELAIHVEGLGKRYSIGKSQAGYSTMGETLTETFAKPLRQARNFLRGAGTRLEPDVVSFWALRDVSFEIKRGEVDILKEGMEAGVQEGCQTFDQALFGLYKDEKIALDQALINADSANNLRLKIKLAGLKVDEEPKDAAAPEAQKSKPEPLQAAGGFRLRKG